MTEADIHKHKFQVGELVHFTPGRFHVRTALGQYRVVRLLPAEGDENQYRLKSVLDGHERVAQESQISIH